MALHPAHYSTTSVATVALLFATPGLVQDAGRMDEVVLVQADNGTCALSPSFKIGVPVEGDKLMARRRRAGNPRSSCSRRRGEEDAFFRKVVMHKSASIATIPVTSAH